MGGGIACYISDPIIINNTISNNRAVWIGGGISINISDPIIANTILWDDTSGDNSEIGIYPVPSFPVINYCDIQDTLWPGDGNISVDPLFRGPGRGDFHLMSIACGDPLDSPCIDAGDPSIFDYLLDCDWGLGGQRSDMGAYGGQAIPTDIREEHPPSLPMACGLLQNYPNPFNAATVINYTLPQSCPVTLSIYNLLGQRVATIHESEKQAGRHSITWDASDFPTGVYFARLEAGEYSKSIKMVLLK
jgi:hypothetical protein